MLLLDADEGKGKYHSEAISATQQTNCFQLAILSRKPHTLLHHN